MKTVDNTTISTFGKCRGGEVFKYSGCICMAFATNSFAIYNAIILDNGNGEGGIPCHVPIDEEIRFYENPVLTLQ